MMSASRLAVALAFLVGLSGCVTREGSSEQPHRRDLMELGLSVHHFHDVHKRIPLDIKSADGTPLLSWRVDILQLVDPELYQEFHLQEPWDSPHNSKLIAKIPRWYASLPDDEQNGQTTVMMFTGPKTAFENPNANKWFAGVIDGLSHTIMVVEAGQDKAAAWTKPIDLIFDPADPKAAVGQIPETGLLAVFYDAYLRRIARDVPPSELAAMITAKGGETIALETWAPSARKGD